MVDSQLRLVTGVLHINTKNETGICELYWRSCLQQFLMIFQQFWQQTTTFNVCVTGPPVRKEITGNPRKVPLCTFLEQLTEYRKNSPQRTCSARQVALTTSVVNSHWVDTIFAGKYSEANLPATHVFGGHCRVTHNMTCSAPLRSKSPVPENLQGSFPSSLNTMWIL